MTIETDCNPSISREHEHGDGHVRAKDCRGETGEDYDLRFLDALSEAVRINVAGNLFRVVLPVVLLGIAGVVGLEQEGGSSTRAF